MFTYLVVGIKISKLVMAKNKLCKWVPTLKIIIDDLIIKQMESALLSSISNRPVRPFVGPFPVHFDDRNHS